MPSNATKKPLGRPPKHKSERSRNEARKAQTRESVQRWRTRRAHKDAQDQQIKLHKALAERGLVPARVDEHDDTVNDKRSPPLQGDELSGRGLLVRDVAVIHDFRRHSEYAPIDLSFGVLQAVLYDCRGILDVTTQTSTFTSFRGSNRLLRSASFAAAAQWVSKDKNTPWIQINALEAYEETVQGTYRALNVVKTSTPEVTAGLTLTCLSLAYFEVFSKGWQCKEWVYHLDAAKNIIESAGPHTFRNPICRTVLRINRAMQLIMAACYRKRTFLDLVDWRTVPYDNLEQQDLMYYATAPIPGILGNCDILAGGDLSAEEHGELLEATLEQGEQCMDEFRKLQESMDETDNISNAAFLERSFDMSLESSIPKFRAMCFMYMLILGCNIRGLRRSLLSSAIPDHLHDPSMLEHCATQLCAMLHIILNDELERTQAFHFFASTQLVLIRQYHDLVEPSCFEQREGLLNMCGEAEQLVESNPHAEISRALGDWARLSRLLEVRCRRRAGVPGR